MWFLMNLKAPTPHPSIQLQVCASSLSSYWLSLLELYHECSGVGSNSRCYSRDNVCVWEGEGCTMGTCVVSRCGLMSALNKWPTSWARCGAQGTHPPTPGPQWLRMQIACSDLSWTSWMASEYSTQDCPLGQAR